MKSTGIAIILLALVVVGIAGPFSMGHGLDHTTDCPVASVAQLSCISLGAIANHITALQGLLTAVPISLATMLVMVMLSLFVLRHIASATLVPVSLLSAPFLTNRLDIPRSQRVLRRWQTRLVHSPTPA